MIQRVVALLMVLALVPLTAAFARAEPDTRPTAPTGLATLARAERALSLVWDADPAAARWVVRRVQGPTPATDPRDGVGVPVVPGSPVAAAQGLSPGTVYSFSVFPVGAGGGVGKPATIRTATLVKRIYTAGDIGWCREGGGATEQTARLIPDGSPFFALGDIAYFSGTEGDFRDCYRPYYGRLRSTTFPTPGNHEHRNRTIGYRKFFGDRVGTRKKPWYSVRYGNWRILMLDSNCRIIKCGPGSRQYRWVRETLASEPARCLAAAWHHPRWATGRNGNALGRSTDPLYRLLAANGADVLLTGHLHRYERFARVDGDGRIAPDGIRQFVVGTGGAPLLGYVDPRPSLQRFLKAYGILRLDLGVDGYSWAFLDTDGNTRDAGSDTCTP